MIKNNFPPKFWSLLKNLMQLWLPSLCRGILFFFFPLWVLLGFSLYPSKVMFLKDELNLFCCVLGGIFQSENSHPSILRNLNYSNSSIDWLLFNCLARLTHTLHSLKNILIPMGTHGAGVPIAFNSIIWVIFLPISVGHICSQTCLCQLHLFL